MKDRIVVIDTFSYGSFHEMFNAEMLKVYSCVFKDVSYYGVSSNIDCIQKICMGHLNIQYNRLLFSISINNRLGILIRYLWSAVYSMFLLLRFRNEQYIAINYDNPFLLPLLRICGSFLKSSIYICCHGELELLTEPIGKNGLLALAQRKVLLSFFHSRIHGNIHFLVLGESIIENLVSIIPNNKKCFSSINHPYKFRSYQINKESFSSSHLRVGIIGGTNKNKGYDLLMHLVKNIDFKKGNGIELWHIGKISGDICFLKDRGVHVVERTGNGDLSRNVYEELVESLQFVLFLYPVDSYKVTASGAIFEAISNLKPIIALSNPFFEYIFSIMGKIGYLFRSMDELEQFMLTFHLDEEEYLQMQNNMLQNRTCFSAEAVSDELNELIK